MKDYENQTQKGVIRPPILPVPDQFSKQLNAYESGDNPLYQPRETYSNHVSRPLECGFTEKSTQVKPPLQSCNSPYISSDEGGDSTATEAGGTTRQHIKRLAEIIGRGVQWVEINQDQLIDGKYIPHKLIHSLMQKHRKKVVLLGAGLGVGKSTSSAALMNEYYGGKGVAMCHRIGLTQQLCRTFEADNYQEIKKAIGGLESDRVGTTIHSLPDMLRIERSAKAFDGGLAVLDESNSAASEMLTSTIKNEAVVINAVGDAVKRSKAVICADAHMDAGTLELLQAAGVDASDMLLIIVNRPELKGYKIKFFEDEEGPDGTPLTRAAFINQILADLRAGLKVIVTSLSAAFLDELDREAEKQGLLGRIKVTRSTPMSLRDQLTANSYQDFELVMLSPAMSTGISFDGGENYRHADRSYVILSNCQDTGTYQDGLQAMMRERAVKDNTIHVYYQESPVPLPAASRIVKQFQIQARAIENFLQEHGLLDEWNKRRPGQSAAEAFLMSQALRFGEHKRNFKELFLEECRFKGAVVQMCNAPDLAKGDVSYQVLQDEKAREREEKVQAIADAFKYDPEGPDDLAEEILQPALDRQYIEQQAIIDFDGLEEEERKEWIDRVLPSEGTSIVHSVREIERAFADKNLLTEIVKVALIGAAAADDDRVQFMEKSGTSKVHWLNRAKYTRWLLQAAGVREVSGEWMTTGTTAINQISVKNPKNPSHALYSSLIKNPVPAIESGFLGIETNPEKVKADPLPHIIDMMTAIGISSRKKRNKAEWTVNVDYLETKLAMVNRRKESGMNQLQEWLDHVSEYLSDKNYQRRKSVSDDRNASTRQQAPDNVVSALSDALIKVGKPDLLASAIEYFEPFHSRIKSRKLSPGMIEILVKKWLEQSPE